MRHNYRVLILFCMNIPCNLAWLVTVCTLLTWVQFEHQYQEILYFRKHPNEYHHTNSSWRKQKTLNTYVIKDSARYILRRAVGVFQFFNLLNFLIISNELPFFHVSCKTLKSFLFYENISRDKRELYLKVNEKQQVDREIFMRAKCISLYKIFSLNFLWLDDCCRSCVTFFKKREAVCLTYRPQLLTILRKALQCSELFKITLCPLRCPHPDYKWTNCILPF